MVDLRSVLRAFCGGVFHEGNHEQSDKQHAADDLPEAAWVGVGVVTFLLLLSSLRRCDFGTVFIVFVTVGCIQRFF